MTNTLIEIRIKIRLSVFPPKVLLVNISFISFKLLLRKAIIINMFMFIIIVFMTVLKFYQINQPDNE